MLEKHTPQIPTGVNTLKEQRKKEKGKKRHNKQLNSPAQGPQEPEFKLHLPIAMMNLNNFSLKVTGS